MISKKEKLLYVSGIICFAISVLVQVFLGASIGNQKMTNEKIKYEINQEEKQVESLKMQVQELVSFDNIKDIIKELGLTYNNDNIIIVNN